MNTTEYYLQSIDSLFAVAQNLFLADSLEEMTKVVLTTVREVINSDGATFAILDNGFSYYIDENATNPVWKGQRFPVSLDVSGWVMTKGKTSIIEDTLHDEKGIYSYVYHNNLIRSMAVVPVMSLQRGNAAICIYWFEQHQITTDELKMINLLAKSAGVSFDNLLIYSQLKRELTDSKNALARTQFLLQEQVQKNKVMEAELRRLSLTDELTGLNNSRGFFLLAEQQLRLSKRSKINTYLMFIKIHDLANIKDKFDYRLAEEAILTVSRLLKRSFRDSDTLGRINEDGFVVLIQGYNLAIDLIEERVQTNILQFNQTKRLPFNVEVKIGFKLHNYYSTISLEDMITLAHENAYER
ncbi:MAG: diguanylate cyclase [Nostocales cyanobacterium]|nr:MAG: diguanylate cyclase [Nostocales cyanobacterium]